MIQIHFLWPIISWKWKTEKSQKMYALLISWQLIRFSYEADSQKQVFIRIWQHLKEPLFVAFICWKLEGRWWLNLIWITSHTYDRALFLVQKERSTTLYSSQLLIVQINTRSLATIRLRTNSSNTLKKVMISVQELQLKAQTNSRKVTVDKSSRKKNHLPNFGGL